MQSVSAMRDVSLDAKKKKKRNKEKKEREGKGVDKEAGRGEEERSCLGSWTIKSD